MQNTAWAALPPKSEAPRKSRTKAPRGTIVHHRIVDEPANTVERQRTQRLVQICGLNERRAKLIAFLAFGEARHV